MIYIRVGRGGFQTRPACKPWSVCNPIHCYPSTMTKMFRIGFNNQGQVWNLPLQWGNKFLGGTRMMNFNPDVHHRRSIRLKNYDYSQKGLYFITICTHGHQCLFGKIDWVYPVGAGSKPAPKGQPRIQFPSNRAKLEKPGLQSRAGLEPSPTEPARIEITRRNPIHTELAGMRLNDFGRIVQYTWFDLVNHVDNIKLHEFIVMPNHVHGIIEIVKCGQIIKNNSPKSVGTGYKPALEYLQPGHNYGNGREMESKTRVNLEQPGLPTGAGLEPAPTKPVRTESTPIRSGDSLHAKSKPNHQIKTKPLSEIVRQLKTFSARCINQLRKTPGNPVWQRNYYEHVIRNESAHCKISEYILNNPRSWPEDRYYKEQSINSLKGSSKK